MIKIIETIAKKNPFCHRCFNKIVKGEKLWMIIKEKKDLKEVETYCSNDCLNTILTIRAENKEKDMERDNCLEAKELITVWLFQYTKEGKETDCLCCAFRKELVEGRQAILPCEKRKEEHYCFEMEICNWEG